MRRRGRRRAGVRTMKICFIAIGAILGASLAVKAISLRVMPVANAIAAVEAKNRINRIIFETINQAVADGGVVTADFFSKTEDAEGMITSLSVNTVLVNTLCAELADDISGRFTEAGENRIGIPAGTLTGVDMLANLGPEYTVELLPKGSAEVNYDTRFEAVGINQTNFQVWLDVSVNLRIVNPLCPDEFFVERRVPLVNTVFSGKVPESFIGGIPFGAR